MKRLTVDDVMEMEPCSGVSGYPRERVVALWAGRDALTAREIGALDIPARDRVWVLVRMLPKHDAILWACDLVETALDTYWMSNDRRPNEAVKVARRFVVGDATAEELVAARSAVSGAIFDAGDEHTTLSGIVVAWAVKVVVGAGVGAADAAWHSAYLVSRDAAAARAAQIESLIARIEELFP